MNRTRQMWGGVLGFIGFMLSPLSWWNDAFVNLPLAAGAAWVVARFHPPAFQPAFVVAYWLTNVLGLVLLHKGARQALAAGEQPRPYGRHDLVRDAGVSVAYTLIILALLRLKLLQPLSDYLGRP